MVANELTTPRAGPCTNTSSSGGAYGPACRSWSRCTPPRSVRPSAAAGSRSTRTGVTGSATRCGCRPRCRTSARWRGCPTAAARPSSRCPRAGRSTRPPVGRCCMTRATRSVPMPPDRTWEPDRTTWSRSPSGPRMRSADRCTPVAAATPPDTAVGVLAALHALCAERFGSADLSARSIAVLGLGRVGGHVLRMLADAGATLVAADIDEGRRMLADTAGAAWTSPQDCLTADVDVLVPAALGGLLTPHTVPTLRCAAIAGPANNQLDTPAPPTCCTSTASSGHRTSSSAPAASSTPLPPSYTGKRPPRSPPGYTASPTPSPTSCAQPAPPARPRPPPLAPAPATAWKTAAADPAATRPQDNGQPPHVTATDEDSAERALHQLEDGDLSWELVLAELARVSRSRSRVARLRG